MVQTDIQDTSPDKYQIKKGADFAPFFIYCGFAYVVNCLH